MKTGKYLLYFFFLILIFAGCSSGVYMTGSKMDNLELGMSKVQLTKILGKGYTIAEKRIENGSDIEVLSYRDLDEFYMFVFTDNKLEKWYRELLPKYETPKHSMTN